MKRLLMVLLGFSLLFPVAVEARRPKAAVRRKAGRTIKAGKAAKAGKARKRRVVARPLPTYTAGGLPNIQAQAALVVDLAQGTELYAKRPDEVRPIASISKLLAMMVVLERPLDLDGATIITEEDRRQASGGARSRLPVGVAFTNRDLLHAVLMASDNRAVPALGRAVGLSPAQLTQEMNRKAKALGLVRTAFGDPTGLDNRNRSTPREVVKMLAAALKVPLIGEVTRTPRYVAHAVGKSRLAVEYLNTDIYARGKRFAVLGGKTGYTDEAGYCLAIAARLADRREVAMVFLGAQGKLTRFADFSRAAQWLAEKLPLPSGGGKAATAASAVAPPPPAPSASPSQL